MKVLLLGSGGREHALGWKLVQGSVTSLLSAPGNPGLDRIGTPIPNLDITEPDEVATVATAHGVDLVVVGPEAPLAAGVVDALADRGIPAFGPTEAGAQLEASKAFAKDVMRRAGVPTAAAATFTDVAAAEAYIEANQGPFVVKADGLAAGKGVLVTEDPHAAAGWARLCLTGHFGQAGSRVVIEEYLEGREVSVFALCDGSTALALEPAQDYKRLRDHGLGPNTGGMGAYSPVHDLPEGLVDNVMRDVVEPVLAVLAEDGIVYRGFLYVGVMLTADGPYVLEFNTRLGDPETQVLMPRLDEDLGPLMLAGATGTLPKRPLRWHSHAAVDVVLASEGYPENPITGRPIAGLDDAPRDDVVVFHAGTRREDGTLVTSGGRVLNVVGLGPDLPSARERAYEAAERISFEGMQYRTDIADRATSRLEEQTT